MRIVIVNTHMSDHIGGSQLQCDLIAEGLNNKGHEIIYLAIDKKSNYKTSYKTVGVERSSEHIANKIIELNPDIVYWRFNKRYINKTFKKVAAHDIKIIFASSNIKDLKAWSQPFPSRISFSSLRKYFKEILLSIYNYRGYKYVHAITVNNEEQLKLAPSKNTAYIPNAVSTEQRSFTWERPYVLWVANIKKRKRPDLYVKLAEELKEMDVDFLMIGGIADRKFQWIADKDHTPPNLHYLGEMSFEEVNGAIAGSLLLAATSTPEGFSNNIIQSWLQEKPVVAYEFDPGGLIEQNKLGYVAHSDFRIFKRKIEELINDEQKRTKIGAKAKNFASEYFSTEYTVDTLEKFMLEIVE
jgi:glycosyltransferase involved in cell wall biosynthesis